MIHWCSVHHEQWCEMAEAARSGYARRIRRKPKVSALVMVATDKLFPGHGAFYARDDDAAGARRVLRGAIAAAKRRATLSSR